MLLLLLQTLLFKGELSFSVEPRTAVLLFVVAIGCLCQLESIRLAAADDVVELTCCVFMIVTGREFVIVIESCVHKKIAHYIICYKKTTTIS